MVRKKKKRIMKDRNSKAQCEDESQEKLQLLNNLGYYFVREYLNKKDSYKEENEIFCKFTLTEVPDSLPMDKVIPMDGVVKFDLKTQYPGLVTGVGMPHELPGRNDFCVLGFYFDYTTGWPVIPGATVKGVLRSVFPQWDKHFEEPDEKKEAKTDYIWKLLKEIGVKKLEENWKKDWVNTIEKEIFDGIIGDKNLSIYNRDLFFDAYVSGGTTKSPGKGRVFGIDNITPHKKENLSYEESLLKEPIPLTFLKILPGVVFTFQFRLSDHTQKGGLLKNQQKLDLFQKILLDVGIGAKTNVGYGQLEILKQNS